MAYGGWTSRVLMKSEEFNKLINMYSDLNTCVAITCTQHAIQWVVLEEDRQFEMTYTLDSQSNEKIVQILCKQNIKHNISSKYLTILKGINVICKYVTITMDDNSPIRIEAEINKDTIVRIYIAWQEN